MLQYQNTTASSTINPTRLEQFAQQRHKTCFLQDSYLLYSNAPQAYIPAN